MIPYGLFSQTLFLLLSVALVFTYIKPTFSEIDATQDKIETYEQEIEKVSAVNDKLANLVAGYDNISQTDRLKILTYMPDEVDTIAVPRDLYAIGTQAGVIIRQIEYIGSTKDENADVASDVLLFDPEVAPDPVVSAGTEPEGHRFEMSFEGSYAQVKTVLALMEENVYPLEVHELDISRSEGGFLTVKLSIITYDSVPPQVIEAAIQ